MKSLRQFITASYNQTHPIQLVATELLFLTTSKTSRSILGPINAQLKRLQLSASGSGVEHSSRACAVFFVRFVLSFGFGVLQLMPSLSLRCFQFALFVAAKASEQLPVSIMSAIRNPLRDHLTTSWMMTYLRIGEHQLEFEALRSVVNNTLNPMVPLLKMARTSLNSDEARQNLLEQSAVDIFYSGTHDPAPYAFERGEDVDEEEDETRQEYAYRHPDSQGDGTDDYFANVFTKVSRELYALDMVAPGGDVSCSLRPAHPHQISIRLDENDKCFYYECFEYKPAPTNAQRDSLPSERAMKVFNDSVVMASEPRRAHGGFSDDEEEEEDGDNLDEPIELVEDTPENRKRVHQEAIIGGFFNSRVMRVKVPLDSICGLRLRKPANHENNDPGVLVIELAQPTDDFASRHVATPFSAKNRFRKFDDWTPEQVASRATRHYIYASVDELRELVEHICCIDTRIAAMLSPGKSLSKKMKLEVPPSQVENTLEDAILSYDMSPEILVSETAERTDKAEAKPSLTTTEVDQLFINHRLASDKNVKRVNLCLKAAVLNGHYEVSEATDQDTVLYSGRCHGCGQKLSITWGEALFQSIYPGLDYADGGENAPIQCPSGNCGGNYITGLCEGKPEFDSGKFHNHCPECPEFGCCIHDYRNDHCGNCGNHYFAGNTGFECENCGNGRADRLFQNEGPPSDSAWNGESGPQGDTLGGQDGVVALFGMMIRALADSIESE